MLEQKKGENKILIVSGGGATRRRKITV